MQYDYGFRIYDPQLARFKSVDPLTKSYPWNSPYTFAENDVIRSIDLDGLEKLLVHEVYDKYGRRNKTELSGIRDIETKNAINLDMASKMGVPLAKEDVYILRHRNSINGPIFFEGNGGSLTKSNISTIARASSVQGEEVDYLPEGTMQQGETTSRGRFYFSPPVNNSKNEFFESQFHQRNSEPITKSNKLFSDFVVGSLVNGNIDKVLGLKASEATTIISRNIDGFVADFKSNNGINVAFIEQITITIANNSDLKGWNTIQKNLSNKYSTKVIIKIDANIVKNDTGAKNVGETAGSYGSINYSVSGVRDGDPRKASSGAQ